MTESSEPQNLSDTEVKHFIARLNTKGVTVLIYLAIIFAVQMFRLGVTDRYILMLAGSVLSMAVLYAYPRCAVRDGGKPERSPVGAILAIAGFIPYLFSLYLLLYEGFWRLRLLLDGFSVAVVIVAVLYIVGGYFVLMATHKVSEFGRAVTEGRIRINRRKPYPH